MPSPGLDLPAGSASARLREQAVGALRELLSGFERADRQTSGRLLDDHRRGHLPEIYRGLVTVLLRMVFVLYAEDEGLLPLDSVLYAASYSLTGLHAQLGADVARDGEAIDDRYGAWPRVITLFRILHDGVEAPGLTLPRRRGDLFDPGLHPFLEGRPRGVAPEQGGVFELPRISDGIVYRVLDQLLVLGGERLRYQGLDVEQVGSVYEGLMGFEVEEAEGDSLAVAPEHVVVDLEKLVALAPAERLKALKSLANLDVKDRVAAEVKAAGTVAELAAALGKRASSRNPGVIARGSLFLQPGEERRKTGAHYTPRSLTEPIVATTLRPLLERLGEGATAEAILDLKICDPAMGSGAFLVEACRQLADRLVEAWGRTKTLPALPVDEDPVLHARRLVAQRCLYGVDRNPLAVDLARLSLWLVTFAREHPFTFVDHALRCGDSLVGLSREQIAAFSFDTGKGTQVGTVRAAVEKAVGRAEELRRQIHAIGGSPEADRLMELGREANEALERVRVLGDLMVAAFFSEENGKARKGKLDDLALGAQAWLATGEHDAELRGIVAGLREGPRPVLPLHWEVEFPEVLPGATRRGRWSRAVKGFDAIVGNPPWVSYAGRAAQPLDDGLRRFYGASYEAFAGYRNLQGLFVERCASLLRPGGRLGVIVPSSMSEQDGYGPSRLAHDRLCVCDQDLPDLGDSFAGVFQPSMLLRSTRAAVAREVDKAEPWPVERPDLDGDARALLAAMARDPLPPHLFGERGLQSSGEDTEHLRPAPDGEHTVALRSGGDIEAFRRKRPSTFAAPGWFGPRLRAPGEWSAVSVLIRQTARVPTAALADGDGFRNSILAGFEDATYPATFLVAYLNSSPIRWLHYMRHRDARQGMPQMKIGHLRATPAPPPRAVEELARFGAALSGRNQGITAGEQERLDALVAQAFGLSDLQRDMIGRWAREDR